MTSELNQHCFKSSAWWAPSPAPAAAKMLFRCNLLKRTRKERPPRKQINHAITNAKIFGWRGVRIVSSDVPGPDFGKSGSQKQSDVWLIAWKNKDGIVR